MSRGIAGPLVKSTIFAVVTIVATAVLGVTIANTGVGDTTSYTARFTDATGLNTGDDVRIAGVRVGQVTDLRVVDRRFAEVVFSVKKDHPLPASVTATIKYRNLVGQRYVALGRGAGPVGGTLPPGGRIPVDRTTPALDLTELFNGFQPLFTALTPSAVNELSGQIVQVLQGEGSTVDSLVAHTASLAQSLADKDRVIGAVIDNLNAVLETVNSRGAALRGMVSTLQQLVSGLAADRRPIGDAVSALSELTDSTAGLLGSARAPLKADIAALGDTAGNLNAQLPTVESFLRRLPVKMQQIGGLVSYGSWFNFYLCSAEVSGVSVDQDLTPAPSGIPVTESRCTS
jgi:phospholipid/cholesterol/gamma-HCH transport system substrate-binding protein